MRELKTLLGVRVCAERWASTDPWNLIRFVPAEGSTYDCTLLVLHVAHGAHVVSARRNVTREGDVVSGGRAPTGG